MRLPSCAYVGLGSNLDDPRAQVTRAIEELDNIALTRLAGASRCYISRPVGPQDQPDFVNAVVALETRLSPLALLDQLQALEQRHRRVRKRHWGPRSLDLDLLLYDNIVMNTPRLTLPHPYMQQRSFVMLPLAELTREVYLPDGRRISSLAAQFSASDLQPLLP
ncbi:2-amino-4-hydroxy-6-hydroxymethyldihydropteridine diphosphokinase [Pistricoccus aurantiacus]|uniref:2-amino-4-hydroxy-6-hydroxymethyldihydropteridine pyrophosphokinase n=1 Tax=Pistricoccus aurantiacus TaxID=1883414 RepID=A0A5B8SUE8_9GAMM|nr:2-amino-4-hydroxy-6-hydroxymethyldihydropteridine diphosphokinase [Pistricoccus aurantiacus]QEA38573.1 2-amino-4-hydroxy-6-hydroxymethyldihydropteridine diphosphokinase [Pistricoccus aurantiacus]